MTTPIILATDLATRLGYAHSDGESGVVQLTGTTAEKLESLYDWLNRTIDRLGCTLFAHEDAARVSNNQATHLFHGQILGVVTLVCRQRRIPIWTIHPTTLKAWLTGSGRAKKDQMIRAVKTMFGVNCEDDNQADAIAVLNAAMQGIKPMAVPKRLKPRQARSKAGRLF